MPQPPYALARVSINGGAVVTGGRTIAGGSTVQLSADPGASVGVTNFRWEIYDYPLGFALPASWSSDPNGVYYSTAVTPPVFTVAAASSFGKYMLRLTANNGISANPAILPPAQLVDEATSVEVLGISGLHDTGFNETSQWSAVKLWLLHLKANWRIIDSFINTGGGGGGVTVHGALTGLAADDHTQYVLVSGTRAMTGALAMGAHKITGVTDPTNPQDVATKAYVDASSSSGTGFIRANGSVPFTANQPLGGFKLTGVGTPASGTDAATKGYVDAQIIPAGTNAFTGDQSMGGHKLTNLATPAAPTDAVTKGYADAIASGMTTVRLATAAALPTNTRTGNVLTASANAALTVDGTAVAVADVLLVKNEVTAANDGLYVVTAAGSGAAAFVLTRTATPINSGMPVAIAIGTANGGKIAVLKTDGAIVVNTTALDFQIATGAAGADGTDGVDGVNGTNGTNGVDAFNAIPSATLLTGATQTIAPGVPGVKFTLPAGSQSSNAVLTLVAGSGLRAFDSVFIEVFDVSAFTYTIRNGGATPADMLIKPASPGCKRIYSVQWDGTDFFACNAVPVV